MHEFKKDKGDTNNFRTANQQLFVPKHEMYLILPQMRGLMRVVKAKKLYSCRRMRAFIISEISYETTFTVFAVYYTPQIRAFVANLQPRMHELKEYFGNCRKCWSSTIIKTF